MLVVYLGSYLLDKKLKTRLSILNKSNMNMLILILKQIFFICLLLPLLLNTCGLPLPAVTDSPQQDNNSAGIIINKQLDCMQVYCFQLFHPVLVQVLQPRHTNIVNLLALVLLCKIKLARVINHTNHMKMCRTDMK